MVRELSPAQQQYVDLKKQHKDALLFFRMGDFYETFYEDAHIAHKVLGITLTARDKKSDTPIPMAGIPYHSLDKYTPILLQAGYKIALAEQVGQVVPGTLVERKVTQVLTPGTVIEHQEASNYIVSLVYNQGSHNWHIAWGDVSLGMYKTISCTTIEDALKKLLQIEPREIVIDIDIPQRDAVEQYIRDVMQLLISFDTCPHDSEQYLQHMMHTSSLAGYGMALTGGRQYAMALLLSYVERMQQDTLMVYSIAYQAPDHIMMFDDITRDNLEVFVSRYEGSRQHSLYHVLKQHIITSPGARLLHERLSTPITDIVSLEERLRYIRYFADHQDVAGVLKETLRNVPDLPRLLARLHSKSRSPQLLQSFTEALGLFYASDHTVLRKQVLSVVGCTDGIYDHVNMIYTDLSQALQEIYTDDTDSYIKPGYDSEIDKCRQVAHHADDLLLQYQQDIQEYVGATRVRLKFIKNQGYVLEVTPKDVAAFESTTHSTDEKYMFLRGQTLKNAQRYTTPYLQSLQEKILRAQDELLEKEYAVFLMLLEKVHDGAYNLSSFFGYVACVDVSLAMSFFVQDTWVIPHFHTKRHITIRNGRHPVVEHFLPHHTSFVANDFSMSGSDFHIITGPNMGGKSTFLRQNALIILLAHAGLPAPADVVELPIFDGLFARIGAGDALAKHQSTFMTEMLETANILHNATKNSFIILDELGRGTSTYDGMALAESISVYISQYIQAKTLFATHYHELTDLEKVYDNIHNFSVSVYETDKDVVFMKKIVAGKVNKSYGIDVAALAGLPQQVIENAKKMLQQYEDKAFIQPVQPSLVFSDTSSQHDIYYEECKAMITGVDIDALTPIDALLFLRDIKKRFSEL